VLLGYVTHSWLL